EIAEMIENVGGILSMTSNGGSIQVLSPDRKLGLSLLFECLMDPSFPKDAFTRQQQQMLSEIGDLETKPRERAQAVYRSQLYGKHPYGRSLLGKAKEVAKLTPEDCRAFHRQLFVPNNTMVTLVGDFDSKQVIAEITQLTAGWKKGSPPALQPPEVKLPEKFSETILTMPDAVQLQF